MKLKAIFFLLLLSIGASAQITITADDVPKVGDQLGFAVDTLPPMMMPSAAGPDQTWDFSQLAEHDSYVEEILDPSTTPSGADFPNATTAILAQGSDFYAYLQETNDGLYNIGIAGDILGTGTPLVAGFDPTQKIFDFPSTYLTSYTDQYGFRVTIESPLPQADSVRLRSNSDATVTMDAFGVVTTPHGNYNALRQKTEVTTTNTLAFLIFGVWIDQAPTTTTTVSYSFWNKETKGRLLSYDVDDLGFIGEVTYSTIPGAMGVPPVALFEISDQNGNMFEFTDASYDNITSRLWDFGDGVTMADLQVVSHTYTMPGEYQVCLTVENANGTDKLCRPLSIMAPPIAAFVYLDDGNGVVNFTDNSSNNPSSWSWDFGDSNTSMVQNPVHTYAAAGTYMVCLTVANVAGSNTACQTVNPAFAPVADFAFSPSGSPTISFTDLSTNMPTTWSWDFGDGESSTEQNPLHTYAGGGTFNVCLTATNAIGSDQSCKEVSVIIEGIYDFENLVEVKTFPVPAKDYLDIQLTQLPEEAAVLIIIDALGRKLQERPLQLSQRLTIAHWAAGTYTWTIVNRRGQLLARNAFTVLR